MYEYNCEIESIYDGDTLRVHIDLGFGVWLRKQSIRVSGIDTPEIRTRDSREKKYGYRARDRMRELLPVGEKFVLRTYSATPDKYGRILGTVLVDGEPASAILIRERLAVYYHGQNKTDVEKAHIANWTYLDTLDND